MTTTTRRAPSFDRGGDRNYDALTTPEREAIDFTNWATEQGCRRETGPRQSYAAHAARHLRQVAPERFSQAVASWKAGRADDVYAALLAMADNA